MKLENFLIQFNNSLRFINTSPNIGISFDKNSKNNLPHLPNDPSYIFSLVFVRKLSNLVFHEFRHYLQIIQQFFDKFLYNSKTLHPFLLCFYTNSKITLSRLPKESSYFFNSSFSKSYLRRFFKNFDHLFN